MNGNARGILNHRFRWAIVALLFLLSVINYLDRQTLSVLAPSLIDKLGMSHQQYSYVVTFFLAAYTVSFAVCGWLLDRFGPRIVLAAAVGFWSLAAILHSSASGWVGLAVCRILLGLGEGFGPVGGVKVIGEWLPRKERAFAMGIFSNGNIVGAVLAAPLVVFLQLHFGWRIAFVVTGLCGALWILLWLRFYQPVKRSPYVSAQELETITSGQNTAAASGEATRIWSLPITYGVFIARLLTDMLPLFFSFWLPEYLHRVHHASTAMIGAVAWMPYLAADLGGLFGGALSDLFVRKGMKTRRARMLALFIAACFTPLAAVAVRVSSMGVALACIACVLAAHSLWIVNLFTLITETVPAQITARVTGISGVGGSLGGIAANLAVGQVMPKFGYKPIFTTLGCVHGISFVLLALALSAGLWRRYRSFPQGV
ncbi:MAG TPA: MFS transporter [Acidobacteriaceae bacterium]|jgi:ACS family hexuronate transporter-like MFS transporter